MTSKATRGVYTDLLSLVLSCTQSDTTPQPIFTFNLTRIEVQFFEVTQTDYALNDEP